MSRSNGRAPLGQERDAYMLMPSTETGETAGLSPPPATLPPNQHAVVISDPTGPGGTALWHLVRSLMTLWCALSAAWTVSLLIMLVPSINKVASFAIWPALVGCILALVASCSYLSTCWTDKALKAKLAGILAVQAAVWSALGALFALAIMGFGVFCGPEVLNGKNVDMAQLAHVICISFGQAIFSYPMFRQAEYVTEIMKPGFFWT